MPSLLVVNIYPFVDQTAPVVKTAEVAEGKLVVEATDDKSGVDLFEVNLNNTGWQTYALGKIEFHDNTVIEVRATDKADNRSEPIFFIAMID